MSSDEDDTIMVAANFIIIKNIISKTNENKKRNYIVCQSLAQDDIILKRYRSPFRHGGPNIYNCHLLKNYFSEFY